MGYFFSVSVLEWDANWINADFPSRLFMTIRGLLLLSDNFNENPLCCSFALPEYVASLDRSKGRLNPTQIALAG